MATKKAKKATTAKRKVVKKIVTTETPVVAEETIVTNETSRNVARPQRNLRYLLIPLFIISLVLSAFYLYRTIFPVAIVNGEPILRASYVDELEKQSGKQVVNSMVTKTLIMQEAKKQNVSVSQDEINAEIKKYDDALKQQGKKLDDALKEQGLTRKDLEEQIEIQKLIEKMLGKDTAVSDKEVNDYIAQNSAMLPEGSDTPEMRASIKEQLQQQKLSEKFQTWLADLQKKAKIDYFIAH